MFAQAFEPGIRISSGGQNKLAIGIPLIQQLKHQRPWPVFEAVEPVDFVEYRLEISLRIQFQRFKITAHMAETEIFHTELERFCSCFIQSDTEYFHFPGLLRRGRLNFSDCFCGNYKPRSGMMSRKAANPKDRIPGLTGQQWKSHLFRKCFLKKSFPVHS
jgi:hypothetical protein